MKATNLFNYPKARIFAGVILTLVTTTILIPGMTTYLPLKLADQIAVPILLFPLIWTALFIYSFTAKRVSHVFIVLSVLSISHAYLAYSALA
ncbi:MAG: hypothetical protein AAGB12_07515 [Pseudomonadota bacterium]